MDIKTQRSEELLDSNTLSPELRGHFEAVINATQEGIVVIDEAGIIQTFNPASESLFGYPAAEVIGKNVSLLMPEPHRSEHDNYIQQYLRTGKSDFIGMLREFTALRKDGSSFFIELAANPINLGTKRFFVGTVRDISERKQAEVQRNLLHNISKTFSTSDNLESVIPKVLQTICKFMNWEIIFCWMVDEEKQALRCSHFWHAPDDIEKFKEFVDKSMEMTFENGIGLPGRVCKSSEPHWIVDVTQDSNFPRFPFALKAGLHSGFGFPVTNSKGLIGVIEVFSEKILQPKEDLAQLISSLGNQIGQFFERSELKHRLLKDQQNFFNMLENLPVSFHLQAPDYTVPFANKMFRERFGNPNEEKKCFQLMHNRSEPCKVCTPFELFETNETRDSIWTAPDGRTYLTVVTPFQDIDGSNLVMEMAVDITKEKEAEKENELFHQRLHKMVEGCATAYNDESFFQLLVKNLASALQVRCAFIGECLSDGAVQTHAIWFENDFIDNAKYPLKDTPCEFVANKGVYYCPQNVREAFAKDQMLVDLKVDSYMGVPFFDVSGKLLGLLSVMHSKPIKDPEIAQMILEIFAKYAGSALERKKITDMLQRSYKNLKETNEELQDFVHIASHDLQEPLRKIISFGDLIRSRSNTIDEKDIYYLGRMENSSRRLQSLVEDLVNYSTLDSAQARKMEQLDLSDVVQQVLIDLEISIEQSNAKVKIVDLPVIEANRFQMFHLFQNLISNGLKYHREEEPPSLTISGEIVASKSGYCRIDIADNGIGFEEKYLDRIFKPFQRLHASSQFEGTGMGLAICKKIIDKHNGTITAKTKPPSGTTFIIELPVKQEKKDD